MPRNMYIHTLCVYIHIHTNTQNKQAICREIEGLGCLGADTEPSGEHMYACVRECVRACVYIYMRDCALAVKCEPSSEHMYVCMYVYVCIYVYEYAWGEVLTIDT
jgi:hypothetical protein